MALAAQLAAACRRGDMLRGCTVEGGVGGAADAGEGPAGLPWGASATASPRAAPRATPRTAASTRQSAPAPPPLASWFSNLPDVELRPGTALVPGQQSGMGAGRVLHDPALAVTHVSLADMHPALFTPKADEAAEAPARQHAAPMQVRCAGVWPLDTHAQRCAGQFLMFA